VRIPAGLAKDIGLTEGSCADVAAQDGKLVFTPVEGPVYDLDELISQMTEENSHEETEWSPPVGNEFW